MTDQHWSLDKRVPLAFIAALFLQLVGFGWYASKIDSRLSSAEEKLLSIQARDAAREGAASIVIDRLSRLEAVKAEDTRRLDRIETKIDRILESRP